LNDESTEIGVGTAVPNLPTLEDIHRKFGEAAEAAQVVETDLGTMLLFLAAVKEGIITATAEAFEIDGQRAADLLGRVDRQTLGTLIKNVNANTQSLDQIEAILLAALKERNRLSHSFYRQHNLRRNSGAGRAIMMNDLESIHNTLLDAMKALSLLSGIDLEALAARRDDAAQEVDEPAPYSHLPL
jgi:hypothetical protein